jgi:hypothetical protein
LGKRSLWYVACAAVGGLPGSDTETGAQMPVKQPSEAWHASVHATADLKMAPVHEQLAKLCGQSARHCPATNKATNAAAEPMYRLAFLRSLMVISPVCTIALIPFDGP